MAIAHAITRSFKLFFLYTQALVNTTIHREWEETNLAQEPLTAKPALSNAIL
jgi:hypothetical protein